MSRRTDALHSPAGAPQPSSSVNGAPIGRPVCVKASRRVGEPYGPTPPHDPRPPGPGPDPVPPTPTPEPDAAAAGPESAARSSLEPVDATTPTEPSDYAALSRALRRAARRHRRERARARAAIPAAELPALAAASFALSKLVVHEKVESWMRRPFVDETAPQAQGPAPALRRRRVAARARAAWAPGARSGSSRCGCTPRRPAGRSRPCSPRGPETTSCRRCSPSCARTRRPSSESPRRPAPRTRRPCAPRDMSCFGPQHPPWAVRLRPPGVPGRVKPMGSNAQTQLPRRSGVRHRRRAPTSSSRFPLGRRTCR